MSDCLSSKTWDLLTLHSFLFFLAILLSSSERDRTEALRSLGRDNKELLVNSGDRDAAIFTIRKTNMLLSKDKISVLSVQEHRLRIRHGER